MRERSVPSLATFLVLVIIAVAVISFLLASIVQEQSGSIKAMLRGVRGWIVQRWRGIALAVGFMLLGFVALGYLVGDAFGHDSWISKGGHQGKGQAAGEWCCGEGDCGALDKGAVTASADGYRVFGYVTIIGTGARLLIDETVPYSEAQPSPDGIYWHCHRPNMTRRCFFAPPPNS